MKIKHFTIILSIVVVVLVASAAYKPGAETYEFQQVTTIESVIPAGLGRSRMISSSADGELNEQKMKNFFSLTGINFKNIKQNDADIALKITEMTNNGWEMVNVTSGVYSSGVTDDLGAGGTGIFITRYLFRKAR